MLLLVFNYVWMTWVLWTPDLYPCLWVCFSTFYCYHSRYFQYLDLNISRISFNRNDFFLFTINSTINFFPNLNWSVCPLPSLLRYFFLDLHVFWIPSSIRSFILFDVSLVTLTFFFFFRSSMYPSLFCISICSQFVTSWIPDTIL